MSNELTPVAIIVVALVLILMVPGMLRSTTPDNRVPIACPKGEHWDHICKRGKYAP